MADHDFVRADGKRPDGGRAFPGSINDGMSLRDYFAGQTISSIPLRSWEHVGFEEDIIKAWAKCAYAVADAMLAQREAR
jgi:hypothetical protein